MGTGALRIGAVAPGIGAIAGCGIAPGRPTTAAAAGFASAGLTINSNSSAIKAPRTVSRSTIVRSTPKAAKHGNAKMNGIQQPAE